MFGGVAMDFEYALVDGRVEVSDVDAVLEELRRLRMRGLGFVWQI
jgi:hypothetical protein